jgi:hypothetical protein
MGCIDDDDDNYDNNNNNNTVNNSVVQVRERTLPTEQLLLVSKVSVNFCG